MSLDAGDLAAYYASLGLSGSDAMFHAEHGLRPELEDEDDDATTEEGGDEDPEPVP